VPAVPELVAIALVPGEGEPLPVADPVGEWVATWTDAEHAAAVEVVREAIARGDVYQANVVGHRSAPHRTDPAGLAARVAALPGA
jgi:para-aminobenzoate synthetase component I